MTLGNMRELGRAEPYCVLPQQLLPPSGTHRRVELSGRDRGAVIPAPNGLYQVRRPRQQDRRAPELEGAAGAACCRRGWGSTSRADAPAPAQHLAAGDRASGTMGRCMRRSLGNGA